MKTPPCIHVHKYQVSLHTHSNQRRLLSATSHNLSLALLRLLLLLGKLAVGDRCGKTFPPARASYYVLDDVSKSQLQVSFDSPPPFPRDAKSARFSRYICAIFPKAVLIVWALRVVVVLANIKKYLQKISFKIFIF